MDQRREGRFKPNQVATVRVLGLRPGPIIQASILDISGSGMRLLSKLPVPNGAPVEIEVNDTVACGTICRCELNEDGYDLGVQVSKTAPVLKPPPR